MKHSQIVKAYLALDRMSSNEMPLALGYQLFKIRKLLKPQWDFQREHLATMLKKYNPTELMDGTYKFKTPEEGEKCAIELNAELEKMNNMDVELADFKRPTIHLDTDIKISIEDIDALSDFVNFVE